jgi:hypothetical protein
MNEMRDDARDPEPPSERALIARGKGGTFRVELEGAFPTGWIGSLSLGVTRANLSIVSGVARRTAPRRWTAAIVVEPQSGGGHPESIDYLALAHQKHPLGAAVPIALESFAVEADERTGALLLEVKGPDRIGFLGSLLDRLAGLALFPEDMTIETQNDWALDRFALKAVGDHAPSPEAHQALLALLEDLRRA